jgi:hypothetical protein
MKYLQERVRLWQTLIYQCHLSTMKQQLQPAERILDGGNGNMAVCQASFSEGTGFLRVPASYVAESLHRKLTNTDNKLVLYSIVHE